MRHAVAGGVPLFSPVSFGNVDLANRVVMAPLTRMRADASGVPDELVAEHYAQRAGMGMIITEGTYPRLESQASVGQPGIVTAEQQAGWARVAEAVHARGGKIAMQLMHAGRVTHPDANGGRPVEAPSAVAIDGFVRTERGKQPFPVPHALTTAEVREVRGDFVAAARRAIDAGLDAVELHGANGYLLHQFLSPTANHRTDEYGGSPRNRTRFVVEVVTAVAREVGPGRVGLRISPEHNVRDAVETDRGDVLATYGALLDDLRLLHLAYLSVLHSEPAGELVQELRRRFGGPLIVNSGFGSLTTRAEALQLVGAGHADAVAVGRPALANPDLVERWRGRHAENQPDPDTYYAGGPRGYTDYPLLAAR